MSSFLTVEDVNTINITPLNELHCIDTSLLSSEEYTDVKYDFVKVSRELVENNMHKFIFKIDNKLWSHRYCLTYEDDSLFTESKTADFTSVSCITAHENVKLYIFLSSIERYNDVTTQNSFIDDVFYRRIQKNEIGKEFKFKLASFQRNGINRGGNAIAIAKMGIVNSAIAGIHFLFLLKKTDLQYTLTDTVLTVGKINHVRLNVDESYLPSGDLVDGDELDAIIVYKGQELPVYYDASVNDYCFDLDLTEKFDNKIVELSVKVYETEYINNTVDTLRLKCDYQTANNFKEFMNLVNNNVEIIRLSNDIISEYSVMLSNDIYIIGEDRTFNLNDYSIIFDKGVTAKLESINFTRGAPCLVQNDDSKLTLINCSFTDCKITDECKGSILSTLDSKNIVTEFNSCSILNSPHSIWHCGDLTINKLTALYDNYENIDTDYSLLLTIVNGITDINNSDFNINFDTNILCSNQLDIKYAQSLISISEDGQLNGITGDKLTNNNSLNYLFNNNSSNIYCKYYYPRIESCVEVTPVQGFNGKSCCHVVLGVDWIFKNNAEIKRLY